MVKSRPRARGGPPETLRAYRLLAGLTRTQVATLAGVDPDTVRRLERGWSPGTPKTRAAIAAALNAPDPDVLFERSCERD